MPTHEANIQHYTPLTPSLHTNGFKLSHALSPGHTPERTGHLPAPSSQFVIPISTVYQEKKIMRLQQLCAAAKAAPTNLKVPLLNAANLMVDLPAQDGLLYFSSANELWCQTFGLNDNDLHLYNAGVSISRWQSIFKGLRFPFQLHNMHKCTICLSAKDIRLHSR